MESTCSNAFIKVATWMMYKLLPCFIQSIVVIPSQLEILKQASNTGLPLVMLPLHRSHLDYIMVDFQMIVNGIRGPLIAAGDNLRMPFFG